MYGVVSSLVISNEIEGGRKRENELVAVGGIRTKYD
jgi:hypothetical protein